MQTLGQIRSKHFFMSVQGVEHHSKRFIFCLFYLIIFSFMISFLYIHLQVLCILMIYIASYNHRLFVVGPPVALPQI